MEPGITMTVVMLIFISCCGTILNSIVIVVFFKSKNKHASTTYILILAFVDFLTCAVTIPLCVVMEVIEFETNNDVLCKSYHLFTATTVPLSAILLAVIAIDRYIHICGRNPLLMSTTAILFTVLGIVLLSLSLGSLCALAYGIKFVDEKTLKNLSSAQSLFNASVEWNFDKQILLPDIDYEIFNSSYQHNFTNMKDMEAIFKKLDLGFAICRLDYSFIDPTVFDVYKKIYSAVYAVSCVIILFLYAKIYCFIAKRRRQSERRYYPHIPLKPMSSCITKETSRAVDLPPSCVSSGTAQEPEKKLGHYTQSSDCMVRSHFVSKKERTRRQNIRTASMLASVAFVFIASFLPAWLMQYRFVPFNNFIYHFYFVYCVINPFIYAFCTSKFKTSFKILIGAKRRAPFIL